MLIHCIMISLFTYPSLPPKPKFLDARDYTLFQIYLIVSLIFLEPVTLCMISVSLVHRELLLKQEQVQFIHWSSMKSRVGGSVMCGMVDFVLGWCDMSEFETWMWYRDSDEKIQTWDPEHRWLSARSFNVIRSKSWGGEAQCLCRHFGVQEGNKSPGREKRR